MSVRIRLRRMGKKKSPHYRLAVVDSRVKRDGRFIEFVGYYNPMSQPRQVKLDEEKIVGWIKNGATCSDTVGSILRDAGVLARIHEAKTGQKVVKGAQSEFKAAARPEKPAVAVKTEKPAAAAPVVQEESPAAVDVAQAPAEETTEEKTEETVEEKAEEKTEDTTEEKTEEKTEEN